MKEDSVSGHKDARIFFILVNNNAWPAVDTWLWLAEYPPYSTLEAFMAVCGMNPEEGCM